MASEFVLVSQPYFYSAKKEHQYWSTRVFNHGGDLLRNEDSQEMIIKMGLFLSILMSLKVGRANKFQQIAIMNYRHTVSTVSLAIV